MKGVIRVAFAVMTIGLAAITSAGAVEDLRVITSTRSVTSLAIASDQSLWVGTRGGVLHRSIDGKWNKFTISDGLPSNEVVGIHLRDKYIEAFTPIGNAVLNEGKWTTTSDKASVKPACDIKWKGCTYTSSPEGLIVTKGSNSKIIPLPVSRGTHITALALYKGKLLVSIFGDGLWLFDGGKWSKGPSIPEKACEITSLVSRVDKIWLGTRREGTWEFDGKQWKQQIQSDEPYDHNCQYIRQYQGDMYISTLEDGLIVQTPNGWKHYRSPVISSNAPRQMAEFSKRLYIRHGNGKVDVYDGSNWQLDIFSTLIPRKQASAIASDGQKLYVAQWGGWSEYDGREWSHHFDVDALKGCATTVIYPDNDVIWIGTQGRGVVAVSKDTGAVSVHDERVGLPDDWIKCIERVGDTTYAGTFVGGLAWLGTDRWKVFEDLQHLEITALASDGKGRVFIATRRGIWEKTSDDGIVKLSLTPADMEVQALWCVGSQLYIGTRTGIYTCNIT